MKRATVFLSALLLIGLFSSSCEKTEGGGGGGIDPSATDPRIIDGFICADVLDNKPLRIDNEYFVDEYVYLWLSLENVSGSHTVRVLWVDPDDDIVEQKQSFDSETGLFTLYFWIDTSPTAPTGQWIAEIYIDGNLMRSYTFWLFKEN